MKIHWHKRAAAQLHQVEDYVLRDFGERIRQEFMDEVEQAFAPGVFAEQLKLFPDKRLQAGIP